MSHNYNIVTKLGENVHFQYNELNTIQVCNWDMAFLQFVTQWSVYRLINST